MPLREVERVNESREKIPTKESGRTAKSTARDQSNTNLPSTPKEEPEATTQKIFIQEQ